MKLYRYIDYVLWGFMEVLSQQKPSSVNPLGLAGVLQMQNRNCSTHHPIHCVSAKVWSVDSGKGGANMKFIALTPQGPDR